MEFHHLNKTNWHKREKNFNLNSADSTAHHLCQQLSGGSMTGSMWLCGSLRLSLFGVPLRCEHITEWSGILMLKDIHICIFHVKWTLKASQLLPLVLNQRNRNLLQCWRKDWLRCTNSWSPVACPSKDLSRVILIIHHFLVSEFRI